MCRTPGSGFICLVVLLCKVCWCGDAQEIHAYPFFKGTVSGTLETLDNKALFGGTFSGNFIEASGSISFLENDQSHSVVAHSLWVEVNHQRRLFIKAGYFPEQASAAAFFPLLNFFQATLFSDTIRWGGSFYPDSTTLAQVKFAHGPFSFKASINPFESAWTVIDLDDPFFPDRQIPQKLNFGAYLGTYTLNKTNIAEPEWSWFMLRETPEYSLEAAWQGVNLDARIIYFNGLDRSISLEPNIVLNTYPYATYDFSLVPRRSSISVLGAAVSLPIQDLTLYGEASHTWNQLLSSKTRKLAGTRIVYPPASADSIDAAVGALWSLPWLPLRLVAEGRYAWLTRAAGDLEAPTLSRAASMALEASFFSGALTATPLFIVSLKDGSRAYSAKAAYAFESGFKLWFLWMQCQGDPDSELGQYSGSPILRLGVDWAM